MFKDTLELLKAHPSYFGSAHCYSACVAHNQQSNRHPHKITLVLSQPRCGSTLLMRLMNGACLSYMVGDHSPAHYEALIVLNDSIHDGKGQHGHPQFMEEKFMDEYRGTSLSRDEYLFYNLMRGMLFKEYGSGFCKTTSIGFGNDLVERFVSMLRYYFEEFASYLGVDFTLVFLTRDHDEIVQSMKDKIGESITRDESHLREMLAEQLEQFKASYQLGDKWITYQELCEDPIKTLNKVNPLYPPNASAVHKIMANKLK